MSRWNISEIFFLGNEGRRRTIVLQPGVNIITGASGTGKSALIKAIDYCLGASQCELPAHVRRYSFAVGVKWVSGESQMITGRIIPPVGQGTSTRMYVTCGRNLYTPNTLEEFDGLTNLQAGKAFIERVFGIGDLTDETNDFQTQRGRATIRHATAYMFVTKDVIYNEKALLHGLDQADEAKGIIETMPYFLRVVNEKSVIDERRLRELRRQFEREERKQQKRTGSDNEFYQIASKVLLEAVRCGMIEKIPDTNQEKDLKEALQDVRRSNINLIVNPNDNALPALYAERKELLSKIETFRQKSRAAKNAIREMYAFEGTVNRQYEKLNISSHIKKIGHVCPVCESPSERGRDIAETLQNSIAIIRSESTAVEEVRPRLVEHEQEIQKQLTELNIQVRNVDERINTWIKQNEENMRLETLGRYRAHLLGKVSILLGMRFTEQPVSVDLNVLRDEIETLESKLDKNARQVMLDRAHRKISEHASKAIAELPTVTPCIDVEVAFYSKPPDIVMIEKDQNVMLRLSDLGSDQNYLAIHIALSFALQRYFKEVKSPVPGFLVFDQISRPYYPAHGEDETLLSAKDEDEEIIAMRKHIDYLFKETDAQQDLQILLIEHAYFADDPRYTQATQERWNRSSGKALIPLDWPERAIH
ncbi:DUF3732 domain-containing protein [Pantoea agglomerans]|uniref:DUF3732 domain-containing protein n=1 Tax=Enterobacter agglomerans TaxID=549 RepID=UPI003C79A712